MVIRCFYQFYRDLTFTFKRLKATIIRMIWVYASNIVFTLKNKAVFISNQYKLLTISNFNTIYSFMQDLFFSAFFLLDNDVYFEYAQRHKKSQSKNLKTLYSKTIIEKLVFLKKTVIFQSNIKIKKICCCQKLN